jgi:rhodanese-related sulfurtransferase
MCICLLRAGDQNAQPLLCDPLPAVTLRIPSLLCAMLHAKMLLAQAFPSLAPSPNDLLLEWRHHIMRTFPSVRHMSCDDLQAKLTCCDQPPLLLDFRTEAEHACSHIADSVRVDPDASAADILKLLQQSAAAVAPLASDDAPEGRRLAVFYCSIGYRSSAAAARVLLCEVQRPTATRI